MSGGSPASSSYRIDRDLARLGGSDDPTPTYKAAGLNPAVLKLAMGTRDAIELRREIWGPEPVEEPGQGEATAAPGQK